MSDECLMVVTIANIKWSELNDFIGTTEPSFIQSYMDVEIMKINGLYLLSETIKIGGHSFIYSYENRLSHDCDYRKYWMI